MIKGMAPLSLSNLTMDLQYVYTRKRHQLGKTNIFTDQPAETLAEIVPNVELLKNFIYRNPVEIGIQNSIPFSAHEVTRSMRSSDLFGSSS